MAKNVPIVLVSASPRRQELLTRLGLPYRVQPAQVDESRLVNESPAAMVLRLSTLKAMAADCSSECISIGADTIVVLDDKVLGKPVSSGEARRMLTDMRAREHVVMTGLTLVHQAGRRMIRQLAGTTVRMRSYSDDEIDAYITSGDPFDKAGAYAIQNDSFNPVEAIRGCYTNVVGLPLCHLSRGLLALGIVLPSSPLRCCLWSADGLCDLAASILDAPVSIQSF